MVSRTFPDTINGRASKKLTTYESLFLTFIFSLIVLPVSQNELRLGLFSLVLLFLIGRIGGIKLSPIVLSVFIFSLFIGTVFVSIGVFNGNPGALFVTPIYVFFPIAYFLLFTSFIKSIENVVFVMKIVIFGGITIGSISILLVLISSLGIPDPLNLQNIFSTPILFPDGSYRIIDYSNGIPKMRFFSTSSLVYVAPFLITLMFIKKSYVEKYFSMKLVYFAAILVTFGVLLGGRRALFLNIAIIPILIYIYGYFTKQKSINTKLFSYVVAFLLTTLLFLAFFQNANQQGSNTDSAGYTDYFFRAFDSGEEDGAYERLTQTSALLEGWWQKFWLGNGFGGFTDAIIRSERRVWEYESQYALILFSTGVIGFLSYLFITLWLFRGLFNYSAKSADLTTLILPNISGMISFLFANATNPYLQAYGHLWVIFFPISILNLAMLREKNGELNE
jgi:hypothetical protein